MRYDKKHAAVSHCYPNNACFVYNFGYRCVIVISKAPIESGGAGVYIHMLLCPAICKRSKVNFGIFAFFLYFLTFLDFGIFVFYFLTNNRQEIDGVCLTFSESP